MTRHRGLDVLVGALSGLLATAAWTGMVYAFHEAGQFQRDMNALTNARLVPAETLPRQRDTPREGSDAVDPDQQAGVTTRRDGSCTNPGRAEVEQRWAAEMRRQGVGRRELADLWAQADTESRFDPCAVSPRDARGVPQFLDATWREEAAKVDPACVDAPTTDIECAARVQRGYAQTLERWLPRGARTVENRWAAYNWGIGRVKKAIRRCDAQIGCDPAEWRDMDPHVKPREPRRYVERNKRVSVGLRRGAVEAAFEWSF